MDTIRPNTPLNFTDSSSPTIKPTSVGTNDSNRTIRPNEGSFTIKPNSDKSAMTTNPAVVSTIRPNGKAKNITINNDIDVNRYQPRDSYVINGINYTVITPLSLTSGEAQVFLVRDKIGDKHVLKIYYKGAKPNANILNKVEQANNASILFKEEFHGDFEDRYFELMKYYDGGTLENADVRRKESVITDYIGKMASAIDFCHHLGFIHRDIKPSNFIFESPDRKNILLGDFGIAVECDANGRCVSDMARTKIYAAPEVYLNTGDGKAKFSTKSDFYSLGIVILFLWMGKDEFTHFEKENELQLATMKAYGDLPIPSSMPPRLLSLVKALIEPNPNQRASFDEIERWLNGENPFEQSSSQLLSNNHHASFRVVFNGEKGLIASSPKELARIMMNNQSLAISFLYKGMVTKWLNENHRPELAVEMERIKEDLYPRNTAAGLEAACYILNPEMTFVDICGNKCSTSSEISNSIIDNFGKYLSEISDNPECRLLIYLQMHNLDQAVIDFRKEFSKNKRLGLMYLAYRLDVDRPWYMTEEGTGEIASLYTCDEILNWVATHQASEQSLSDIVSQAFYLWVNKRNPLIARSIEPLIKYQGDVNYSFGVLYRLNPNVGLFFITDPNASNYVLTIPQLGSLINRCIVNVINGNDPKGDCGVILGFLEDIQKNERTHIDHFLQSKGEGYAKYVDWIKYCLDLKSIDNTKKPGPYNALIALFKIVKGMGGAVYYTFKSGKTIFKPSELSSVSDSDIEDAKNNRFRPLEAWISVFFQEDPNLDKQEKYSYEKKTAEYVNFLSKNGIRSEEVERYENSKNIVESRSDKLRSTLSSIKKSRWIAAIIAILPLGVAALLLAIFWRPDFGSLKFMDVFTPVAIVLTIYFCITDGVVGKIIGEAIWGCAIGAIVSGIIVWLSGFASTITPYVAAAILTALGVYLYNKCFGSNLKEQANNDLLHPGFEHLELEPLHEAYRPQSNNFDSSIGDRTVSYQKELSDIRKTIWLKAIPVGIITVIGIIYFMFMYRPSINSYNDNEFYDSTSTTLTPNFSEGPYGTWVGKIENQNIKIEFEDSQSPKEFSFILKETNNSAEKIIVSGTFDSSTSELQVKKCSITNSSGMKVNLRSSGTLLLDNDLIFGDIEMSDPKGGSTSITLPINVQYEPR